MRRLRSDHWCLIAVFVASFSLGIVELSKKLWDCTLPFFFNEQPTGKVSNSSKDRCAQGQHSRPAQPSRHSCPKSSSTAVVEANSGTVRVLTDRRSQLTHQVYSPVGPSLPDFASKHHQTLCRTVGGPTLGWAVFFLRLACWSSAPSWSAHWRRAPL